MKIFDVPAQEYVTMVHDAVCGAKLAIYAQGFELLRAASGAMGWNLALDQIARIWRAGCIIRGRMLDGIYRALWQEAALPNLMKSAALAKEFVRSEQSWRNVVCDAVMAAEPAPSLSTALTYYDTLRKERLESAALIQGLRDYFGSHGFELIGLPGQMFTLTWHAEKRELKPHGAPKHS
jgi:6-phosphogluconate dehydrogenase